MKKKRKSENWRHKKKNADKLSNSPKLSGKKTLYKILEKIYKYIGLATLKDD